MDERFLINTNIVIYFLEGVLPASSLPFIRFVFSATVNLSVITQIELLGWNFSDAQSASVAESFINQAMLYPLDEQVVRETIRVRKAHKIKLPGAIIAATALVCNLTLVSRNDNDFSGSPNLSIVIHLLNRNSFGRH